jgi:hypothetical protein
MVHFWLADRRGHGTCLIFWRALGLGRLSLAAFALGGRLRREKIGVERWRSVLRKIGL